jgi:TrmH family RNA methyltransferase
VSPRRDEVVTSAHNARFREAERLRKAGERRDRGLILIDGGREIARAVGAGVAPVEAWVSDELDPGTEARAAVEALDAARAPIVRATSRLMDRLAFGDRNEGVVLVAVRPEANLGTLRPGERPLIGVVERVEKPGNLGAILRSADAAGVDALILADPGTDPWNPNVIRASVGTVFTVPLAVASAWEAREWLREGGVRCVAARVDAQLPYTDADLASPVAIVLGSEAHGLTDAWAGPDVTAVRIPMHGVADSLNVSVSAAILFYEAVRQRAR